MARERAPRGESGGDGVGGPAIVQELLFKARRAGLAICEVPIEFVERERGESSLTLRKLIQGYVMVLRLRWWAMTGKLGKGKR